MNTITWYKNTHTHTQKVTETKQIYQDLCGICTVGAFQMTWFGHVWTKRKLCMALLLFAYTYTFIWRTTTHQILNSKTEYNLFDIKNNRDVSKRAHARINTAKRICCT